MSFGPSVGAAMHPHNRLTSLLIEMAGSAAICGVAYAAELLIGAHRRRSTHP